MSIRPPILLYITVKNKQEAEKIAKALLEEQLIACANILPEVTSLFRWEGKAKEVTEALLLAKTTLDKQDEAMLRASELHSYECPCIVAVPLEAAHAPFARWVDGEVR